jgi:DNA polymerase (family 10)
MRHRPRVLSDGGIARDRGRQSGPCSRLNGQRHVSILAHPTGSLIGERDVYEVDIERIIAVARERGCHLELNVSPERLDLSDVHVGPPSRWAWHSADGIGGMRFGIDQARRGWLEPKDVINARPLAALRKLLRR